MESRRRYQLVPATACRRGVLLEYLRLRANVFPKKGHSTTLGDPRRINVLPPAQEPKHHPTVSFFVTLVILIPLFLSVLSSSYCSEQHP